MENVVELKNLRVEFPARSARQPVKVAVKKLNLRVTAGEVFGFLGPNGTARPPP